MSDYQAYEYWTLVFILGAALGVYSYLITLAIVLVVCGLTYNALYRGGTNKKRLSEYAALVIVPVALLTIGSVLGSFAMAMVRLHNLT